MTTCANLLADLNDRLNDTGNSQASEALKITWLNRGIAAMWPKLYKTVRDSSLAVIADTYEYNLSATVGSNSKILRVEVQTGATPNRYVDVFDVDLVPGLTDPILVFRSGLPGVAGSKIRVTAARMVTPFVTSLSDYDGPDGSDELPVLYAMGIASGRRLDDRIDARRYPALQAQGVATLDDMMNASQFWFSQFELLLDRMALPLPAPAS